VSTTVKTGLLIGLLCAFWLLVMGFTGWYKHPILLNAFWVVVLIQIAALVWGLKKTAATNTLGQQILAGTIASLIGGGVLFLFSYLYTTVIFPNYFEELRAVNREMLLGAGKTEAEVAEIVAASRPMETPFVQAIMGFIGTAVTGLIASIPIAAILRKK
jgi:hypothetical protein